MVLLLRMGAGTSWRFLRARVKDVVRGVVVVVVVVEDTSHHNFCISIFAISFLLSSLRPMEESSFQRDATVKRERERERERVGISPRDSSKRAFHSKHFTDITQQ